MSARSPARRRNRPVRLYKGSPRRSSGRRITLYDPLTVISVARLEIVKLERLAISVDGSNGPDRARTSRDPGGAMIDVATVVGVEAALKLFTDRVMRGRE